MYNKKQNLITNRGLENNINCNSVDIEADLLNCIDEIIGFDGVLPNDPPFEKHPYLDFPEYQLQNFEKYIIGTFPPISHLLDNIEIIQAGIYQLILPAGGVIPRPTIPFFHGNNDFYLWKLFLFDYELFEVQEVEDRNEKKKYLINKLKSLKINYSDIIRTTQRNNYSPNDSELCNICPNLSLIKSIITNPKAKYLNFNTSSLYNNSGFKLENNNHLIKVKSNQSLDLFLRTLQDLGFQLEFNLFNGLGWQTINLNNINNFKNKVYTKLKIKATTVNIENQIFKNINREYEIITGPSPSGSASRGLGGNQIYTNWHNSPENINLQTPTNEFRKQIYSHFRNNEWEQLQAMNI